MYDDELPLKFSDPQREFDALQSSEDRLAALAACGVCFVLGFIAGIAVAWVI